MWQRVKKQTSFTSTLSDTHQKQSESVIVDALFVENDFRKSKILGSKMIISINTLKGSLVNHVVKSLGKSAPELSY